MLKHPITKPSIAAYPILLLLSLVFCHGASAAEQDPQAVADQIEALETEINKFKQMLQKTRGERSELEKTLETNELEINKILNEVKQVKQKLDKVEAKLSVLTDKRGQLVKKKTDQQVMIGRQIKASFELGQEQYLKMLLNLEDPNQVSRLLTYYDYFNRARTEQISKYENLLEQLLTVETDITEQTQQLNLAKAQLEAQSAGLLRVRQKRKQNLALLNLEIKRTGKSIDQRLEDQKQLEGLLARISSSINNLAPRQAAPFPSRKGDMLLPVTGRLVHKFGHKRSDGKLTWNGVYIEAELGEPVAAVHYGQVVFSDWLRGFGLLLIINHGQGYLSLYGHNQVLYRETGDWVSAGEVIADVGDSGGQAQAGLYFEIRKAGKPSDPQQWCRLRRHRPA